MPLKKYLNDPGMAPETARAMMDAYEAVLNAIVAKGISGVSTTAIAQKLSNLVHEGETDAVRLAEAILKGLRPKK
jgi:hypothetical protein